MTPQETAHALDRAMAHLRLVQEHQATALFAVESEPLEAKESLYEAKRHANLAAQSLRLAGARIPEIDDKPREERWDLSQLAALRSPTAQELLAGVEALREVAERFDAERGKVVGGSGVDFAEDLAVMALRLREICGLGYPNAS